jgi:hypothetical protein
MFTDRQIQRVNDCIEETTSAFCEFPNIFLTEDDLRMHLCSKLLRYFSKMTETLDHDRSISLHSEVRWYGHGDLHLRSDIVLVDVSTLNVLKYDEMPSKGYGFNFPNGIIELKFRRPIGKPDEIFVNEINEDMNKLRRLREVFKHNDVRRKQTQFWLVAFDKMSDLRLPSPESEIGWLSFTYKFANQMHLLNQETSEKCSVDGRPTISIGC